jgi:aerobic-type carbon monoxide dehydrogenase small subunit (CoxS/CutS family)
VPEAITVSVEINGRSLELPSTPLRPLLSILRDDLRLTGTKRGCDGGECGACTVLVDGVPLQSCLLPAVNVDGCEVQTIEGVRTDERAQRLAALFAGNHALQCGYCTPGFMMTILGTVSEGIELDPQAAADLLAGNLCRCTGYYKIIETACQFVGRNGAPVGNDDD